MTEIYTYLIPLPVTIHGVTTPCEGGYTIYLNDNDCRARQQQAYRHEREHIRRGDFDRENVQQIEGDIDEWTGI